MKIPEIEEWESLNGWCRRLANIFNMTYEQTEVLEHVCRESYIKGVNDILERKKLEK